MKSSVEWSNHSLKIIDQTLIPLEKKVLELNTLESVIEAIKKLRVRGAPAIGITAAYGLLVSILEKKQNFDESLFQLSQSRPTAVNLFWALEKMKSCYQENKKLSAEELFTQLERQAIEIHNEDKQSCKQIGLHGNKLIEDNINIMTICNTGFLATGGIGTALAVIQTAFEAGKKIHVYVTETRPLLQGSRLTTWELKELGIPYTLITDNMAAHVMKEKKISCVITGADRIAANGDSANKIGTYALAVLAKYHKIPFYIAAPISTFDFKINSGDDITIETRECVEITRIINNKIDPKQINCYNPAFDVTPNELIDAIICEKKVILAEDFNTLRELNRSNK